MLIEALCPLHIRRVGGDLHLKPGVPVELPDAEAAKLLAKVPTKVRIAHDEAEVVIEPAIRPDGRPMTPVFWERLDGRITGPAAVGFFCRLGATVGLIVDFEGQLLWVNADLLRSQRQFEQQRPLQVVEPVKGLR